MSILMKLINNDPISDKDLEEELFEVCDRVHSSCDSECPIYAKFGDLPNGNDCEFHKNGSAMLVELRKVPSS